MEATAQYQQRYDGSGRRNTDVARDAKQLETRCDTGEFSARRADVCDYQRGKNGAADAHAVALPHQADQSLTGDHAHPRRQAVEDDQRHRGQQ